MLQQLSSPEFYKSIGVISNPHVLRRSLQKHQFVHQIRQAFAVNGISEESIRKFCSDLYADFERGKQFPHELQLAAIAVVLETRKSDFAEEYLLDLARLNISELSIAPVVARECYGHWAQLPRIKRLNKRFASTKPNLANTIAGDGFKILGKRSPNTSVVQLRRLSRAYCNAKA